MDIFDRQQALQSELLPGESLLWSGQPSRHVIFHKEDVFLIPISLMWGGFAILWEYMVIAGPHHANTPWFFWLWGVPFVVAGQYMIWGRFFYTWWKKGRILYGVTSKRVIVLDQTWGRRTNAAYLDRVPGIQKDVRSDGIGTLCFGQPLPAFPRGRISFDSLKTRGAPTFADVEGAEAVYLIVFEARAKLVESNRKALSQCVT